MIVSIVDVLEDTLKRIKENLEELDKLKLDKIDEARKDPDVHDNDQPDIHIDIKRENKL